MKVTNRIIESLKASAEWMMSDTPAIYQSVYADHKVELVEFNAHLCAKAAILRGMLAYRTDHDLGAAIGFFREGADLMSELPSAVARFRTSKDLSSRPQPFSADGFELPIYTCLLASRYEIAHRLSAAVTMPEVASLSNIRHHVRARILAAAVRNDSEDHLIQRKAFDRRRPKKDLFEPYVQLCEHLIEGDSEAFNATLLASDARFRDRARMDPSGKEPPVYGLTGYNKVVFDFMATALAKLAVHRGMNVEVDTAHVPTDVVHAA